MSPGGPQIHAFNKENPMSLGVLNNLSATYAENNLNNTSNSLSKVLQQLSSGSKINSGSDDAAGLSLVNGLQANSQALAQSATNAQEGVGLLQVADGALSQVTNLLNRAVTLATEVSNGTLTGSQQTAANQEYQSILSEINNIGATTTFNQQKVFGGADVQIYTGDSSTQSASIDSLHFASVNSANVGDAGGQMQYSAGQGVFIDLSHSGTLAAGTDKFSTSGTQTLIFDRDNADGTAGAPKTLTIAQNATVNDVINQINSAGLGLTASLTTGTLAGDAVAGADTGIMITGQINASAVSTTSMFVDAASTIQDGASGQTAAATAAAGNSGVAQISYNAGGDSSANLNTYDLSSQSSAENALTTLNSAVIAVAAQDGYVGSQINTLNAVSQVLSTQQENVQSAQNAVQATDYAQATSNMSKYEILSQTGISALAQANSMQQEVTKLLQ
jgi:flagellin